MAEVIVRGSPIQGLGVFAGRGFSPGEVVLGLDTSRVVDEAHPIRPDLGEREDHCTFLGDGRVVLLPSPERHLNHCCNPSAYLKTAGGRVQVIARRAIQAGEEVTLDYLINTHGGTRWSCHCGAARCRGLLEASFFDLPPAFQQEYLPLLESWFREQHEREVERVVARWGGEARGGSWMAMALVVCMAVACGSGEEAVPLEVSRQSPIVALDTGTVLIATASDTFAVSVEVAETREQQRIGLMERRSLPVDEGMLFVYPEPRPGSASFYMFRTHIPLDIAFLDEAGRIVAIRQMEPCTSPVAEWCERYEPGVPYVGALEVSRDYLADRGVGIGDRVTMLAAHAP